MIRFQPPLDRNRLREAIAVPRRRLAERETDLVAVCEKAVVQGAGHRIRVDDRTTWDRAVWNRYIDTAARLQSAFMPSAPKRRMSPPRRCQERGAMVTRGSGHGRRGDGVSETESLPR
jgi:hypothetical protein